MKRSTFLLAALAAAGAACGAAAQDFSPTSDPVLTGCLVKLEDDVKLPAKEAGVLVYVGVKEGDQVQDKQVLARIDDDEAQAKKKVADYALTSAIERYKDDVDIRYSEKAADTAKSDYDELLETNKLQAKAVTETDVRQAKLTWEKMILSIEKSRKDRELAKYDAYTKKAELTAAELAIKRCTIRAPFDGEVVTIYRDQDEWVSPGDPILRIVRLDTMQVEGAIPQKDYDAQEIQGCQVTIEVGMARGRKEQVQGRITYVSSMVRLDGKYLVRADVTNRQEQGRWLLRDGMTAVMTIHLNTGGEPALGVSRTP
jgi:membrane fusion protein, multidrug efflux system